MTTATAPKAAERPKARENRAREWFVRMLFSPLTGMTFEGFQKLLRENRYAVDPAYWPKAALVASATMATSRKALREEADFGAKIEAATVRPPLFLLGHWRSGTTLLHNLIALDERFTYPDLYQVTYPHSFLIARPEDYALFDKFLPKTRGIDNMLAGARETAEDEFATCVMTTRSPYLLAFPRNVAKYDRYLTFRDVPDAEVAEWSAALARFLKKLTVLKDRPVALKSPTHTARVGLLLELFPDARFLHIRRDPYAVFQSSLNAERKTFRKRGQFQAVRSAMSESEVLDRYKLLYDAYLADRGSIPEGRLHELSFEDLERDPIGELRAAYRAIGLPDFGVAAPAIEAYVSRQAGYKKNEFRPMDPDLKRRVAAALGPYFEEWGYPID